MLTSIAGVLVGKSKNHIVVVDDKNEKRFTVSVRGHGFYCRKCRKPETSKGVEIPDASRDNTAILTVLAIGSECGKRRKLTNIQKKMNDMRPHVELGVEPLDRILVPDDHEWGVTHSPYSDKEFFIDECVAKANLGRETEDG